MALTGRFTFRRSFWGRIVLQVEEEKKSLFSRAKPFKKRWRDATLMDLAAPELRALIDLRYKPHFMAQNEYLAPDDTTASQPVAVESEGFDAVPLAGPIPQARRSARRPLSSAPDVTVELERMQRSFGIRAKSNRSNLG
jgi:hypothetical protein